MPGDFGEVTTIIGLVINFLAFGTPFVTLSDILSYSHIFGDWRMVKLPDLIIHLILPPSSAIVIIWPS